MMLSYVVWCMMVVLMLVALRRRRKGSKFPEVPGALPLLGHAHMLLDSTRLVDVLDDWAKRYGVCEFRVFGQKWLLLADAGLIKELGTFRPRRVVRVRAYVEAIKPFFESVFTAELPEWTLERRLIAPAFSHANLVEMFPVIAGVCDKLVDAAGDRVDDAFALCARFTSDVIGLIGFGQDLEALTRGGSDVCRLLERMLQVANERALSASKSWKVPILGDWLDGGGQIKRELKVVMQRIIDDADPVRGASVLDRLVAENKSEKGRLDWRRLVGNAIMLYVAGSDTTAGAMSWMLFELAADDELQEEARAEARAALSSGLPDSMSRALERFPLLRSIFWETLRLRGAASLLINENSAPINLAGRTLESFEYAVVTPFRFLGAEIGGPRFDGRRWLEESKKGLKPIPQGIMPFGFGVRICPGKDLAELEACEGIAKLLDEFPAIKLQDPNDANHPPHNLFRFTMKPERPIRLRFLRTAESSSGNSSP